MKTGQNLQNSESADFENRIDSENAYSALSLRENELVLRENSATTLDMFLRGDIGMVVGYPSLIGELEKAEKRVN